MWNLWARVAPIADPSLEIATIVASSLFQTLKGGGSRVIYLAEWVCCQLTGEDTPWILVDPPMFMLTSCSMTDAEYSQRRPGIPFADQVLDESDYEDFSGTRLMPSLTVPICVLSPLIFL